MPTFFVKGADEIVSRDEIHHFSLDEREVITTRAWVPDKEIVVIVLTCGASCPDAILDEVLLRVLSLFDTTRSLEKVLEPYPFVESEC